MFGSLSSRADFLIELVVFGQLLAIPVLFASIKAVSRGDVERHRRLQLTLAVAFVLLVAALEVDIRVRGGTAALFSGSAYAGTSLLRNVLYFHLVVAALNALLWVVLPPVSLRARQGQRLPGRFSAIHRALGRAAIVFFGLTACSGLLLYVVGFVL